MDTGLAGIFYAANLDCYMRVVLLSNGETVHNTFPDEGFEP